MRTSWSPYDSSSPRPVPPDSDSVFIRSTGKCFKLPVTRQSASAAIATSMNIASLGSGKSSRSASASTGRPFISTIRRTSFIRRLSKLNLPRVRTSRYSERMRSSKQTVFLPVRTDRRMAAGGPNGDMKPDTSTLVSSTTFNQYADACGILGFRRRCRPWITCQDRARRRPAESHSGHRWPWIDGFHLAIFRTSRYPLPSIWPRACRCSSRRGLSLDPDRARVALSDHEVL